MEPRTARVARPLCRCSAVIVAAITLAAAETAFPSGGIEARPFAREFVPGEVVRFEVATGDRVSGLSGEFLSRPIAFARAHRSGDRDLWVGWGVIPLDAVPGQARYRLTALREGASPSTVEGRIDVLPKSFPEQRLDVEDKFVNPPKSVLARIDRERRRVSEVYARRTPLAPPAAPFVAPVPGGPTSEFGVRRVFNGEPRAPHPGIDLRAASGTTVCAAGPGRVALAADLYYSGRTVIVDHGGGLFTVYAHLSRIDAREGAAVAAGERIGLSGATGRVTGPHLHWGARVGDSIFDPRGLLDPRLFGAAPSPRAEEPPSVRIGGRRR